LGVGSSNLSGRTIKKKKANGYLPVGFFLVPVPELFTRTVRVVAASAFAHFKCA
jgi:hypothetical protein